MAQQSVLQRLRTWKHTREGYGISSIIEGLLAYGFVSWAIDSGSLLAYLFTLIFSLGSFVNLYKGIVYRKK